MDQHPGLSMGETTVFQALLEVAPHQARDIRQHKAETFPAVVYRPAGWHVIYIIRKAYELVKVPARESAGAATSRMSQLHFVLGSVGIRLDRPLPLRAE